MIGLNKVVYVVYIIPFIALAYILYFDLYSPQVTNNSSVYLNSSVSAYFIDIGGNDTTGDTRLLGPFDRISEPINKTHITYRLLEKDLVYFSSKVKQNFSKARIELKFVDTIPAGYELKIGLRNKQEWNYLWKSIYNPFFESLEIFPLLGEDSDLKIYSLNNNFTTPVSSFLRYPPAGSIISTDMSDKINIKPGVIYKESNSTIGELRGDHTFYIYTKGELNLSVVKQDLDMYNGSDSLDIRLYSQAGELIKNITLDDNGKSGNDGILGDLQYGTMDAVLEEDVYRITLTGESESDFLIRSMGINGGNIVVKNPYLAGMFYAGNSGFNLFIQSLSGERLGFITYHSGGFQTVNISSLNYTRSLDISRTQNWYYFDLPPGSEPYHLEFPRGDIIINANGYFSFSNDSYFDPSPVKILPLKNNMELLDENRVDYVIIPNNHIIEDDGWTIASTEYNLSDAYIENDTLDFAISAPHLRNFNYSIPVDWIKIYMEK
ncbi:MAG TPA: hypothetical protein VN368_00855 [Candidatus Methylomirabilis sp.]|nr:hypothetical protein [Candidatus Methylomirabilis sp.]